MSRVTRFLPLSSPLKSKPNLGVFSGNSEGHARQSLSSKAIWSGLTCSNVLALGIRR